MNEGPALKEQKKKYGPESLAILSPARRSYSEYLYRFLIAHGSPNYGHSGICAMQKTFAFTYTLGAAPWPDIPQSNLILIWGKQPVYSGSTRGNLKQILDARERGAKIIAIKPTMEPDVAIADQWIPIRPGTDAALALAMLHVIINEKLYDAAFVEKWTFGFEKLAEHVRKYSPAWAATITGLPQNQIEALARTYATTKPACIDHGNGLEHAPSSNHAVRSIAILMAITGNLDKPGGDVFPSGGGPMPKSVHLKERYTPEWVDKLIGPEFPKPFQPWIEGTSSAYFRLFDSVLTGKPLGDCRIASRKCEGPGADQSGHPAGYRHDAAWLVAGVRGAAVAGISAARRRRQQQQHVQRGRNQGF
jgi:anaerobic selenocysteine-containing dehydrogenase